MVENESNIRKKILKAVDFLKNRLELEYVILFGSYITGAADEYSDIDIAVVSEDFEKMSLEEKASLASEIKLKCDTSLEIHPFSLTEFKQARPTNFIGYISSKGKFYLKNKELVA